VNRAGLLSMVGSNFDAEALVAARNADELLRSRGLQVVRRSELADARAGAGAACASI
jgi:hypothetical protein